MVRIFFFYSILFFVSLILELNIVSLLEVGNADIVLWFFSFLGDQEDD